MQTVVVNRVIRKLEETALDMSLVPVLRSIAKQWLNILNDEYTLDAVASVYKECHEHVCTYVEMLHLQWCAAAEARVTRKSFEEWVSDHMIGKVTSGDFIAIPFEDGYKPIMPSKVAAGQVFRIKGYWFKLMLTLDGEFAVIAEIHADPTSL